MQPLGNDSLAPCDLLVFAPHPDDAEIFIGGTIALSVTQGHRVVIVDLSRGELASRGTVETRAKELEKASSILGVHGRKNLGLPDGSIGVSDHLAREQQLLRVVETVRELQPQIVFAPYWEERHPDHVRSSALIEEALFFSGVKGYEPHLTPWTPLHTFYYELRSVFSPSLVVDTTAVWERKKAAMTAYESQFGLGEHAGGFETLLSSTKSLSSIEARDRRNGAMIGADFGEALLSRTALPLLNPVELMKSVGRRHPYLLP
jgi:N-acetylglucosamine malate deacetylase 1